MAPGRHELASHCLLHSQLGGSVSLTCASCIDVGGFGRRVCLCHPAAASRRASPLTSRRPATSSPSSASGPPAAAWRTPPSTSSTGLRRGRASTGSSWLPPRPTPGSASTTCCWCGRWIAWTAGASRVPSGCCAASTRPGPRSGRCGSRGPRPPTRTPPSYSARSTRGWRGWSRRAVASGSRPGWPAARPRASRSAAALALRIAGRAGGRDTSPAGNASGQEEMRAEMPATTGPGLAR
jgi:hypothetical protein